MNFKYIFSLVTSLLSVTETSIHNISHTDDISGTSKLFDSNSDELDDYDYIECGQTSYLKKELEGSCNYWNNFNRFNNKILPTNPIRLSQFFVVEPDRVLLRLFYYIQANKFNGSKTNSQDLTWPYVEIIDARDNIKFYIRHLNKII